MRTVVVICLSFLPNASDMSLSPELAKTANVILSADDLIKLLTANSQTTPMQVETYETKTLAMLKAGGVPTDALNDMVSLRQLWLACRTNVDSSSTDYGPAPASDAPLGESDKTKLSDNKQKKHGYIRPCDMMLNDSLLG